MASKHMVTCVECGRRFDANWGGYYNRHTRRYTCKKCGRAMNYKTSRAVPGSSAAPARRGPSMGGVIAKIAIGLFFVICGFSSPSDGWSVGYFLTALVIGGALIVWGVLSYRKIKEAENAQRRSAAEMKRAAREQVRTCPACGANTRGDVCEYCGTPLA